MQGAEVLDAGGEFGDVFVEGRGAEAGAGGGEEGGDEGPG